MSKEDNYKKINLKQFSFDGVIPSPEDSRDYTRDMVSHVAAERTFPSSYRAPAVEIYNQGSVGSCVAHAVAALMALNEENAQSKHNTYSRGFIYGNRRPLDWQGKGMIIRQALRQVNKVGDVLYDDCPFNIEYPKIKEKITDELIAKANDYRIDSYYRCYTDDDIKECVMERGGVIICVPVYENFSTKTFKPEAGEKLLGYHALVIVGWDDAEQMWIVQNSWGKTWGREGYLLLSYEHPRTEAWGIVYSTDENKIEPKKLTLWERIVNFFKKLIENARKRREENEKKTDPVDPAQE